MVVSGMEMGDTGESGERFVDNQRIEGNISDLLDGAIRFSVTYLRFLEVPHIPSSVTIAVISS